MLLVAETAAELLGERTKKKKDGISEWKVEVLAGLWKISGWMCLGGCTCSLCGRQQRLLAAHTVDSATTGFNKEAAWSAPRMHACMGC